MISKIRHDSHSHVVNSLGQRIASADLAAGSVLTLADLEAEYGVSRTVVREAIRVLESHGMVVSRRRVGVTIQPRSNWDALDGSVIRWTLAGPERESLLMELTELRSAVEPVAARLAAVRATPEQREQLVELASVLERLGRDYRGDGQEFLEADIKYHTLLLEASGNPLLIRLAGPISEVLTGRVEHGMIPNLPAAGTLEDHVAAAQAITSSDPEGAEEAIRGLVEIITGEISGG